MEKQRIKPYIFGHRGAMGYEIENTMPSFRKAVETGAGIETDVQLTKDNVLVCFHDTYFSINNKHYEVKELNLKELKKIKFQDKRVIPTLEEVFLEFLDENTDLRFSFDIFDKETGIELIKLSKKFEILENIEITDLRIDVLSHLRKHDKKTNLVHTLPLDILDINSQQFLFKEMIDNHINIINVKADKNRLRTNLTSIIDHGFKCYCWGVNYKSQMKKVLKWKYKNEFVKAIYTNYPDVLICLRDKFFS
ncbi:MAG: glycerophosphodiester phosphodiesterase [Promethearchaeota archaeon]